MSQGRVVIPFDVDDLDAFPAFVEPRSRSAFQKDPAAAKFRFTDGKAGRRGTPVNAWQLRDRFLSWPLEEWQRFFEISGEWDVSPMGHYFSRDDFEEWQRLLRAALVRPAKDWGALDDEFDWRKVYWLRRILPIKFEWDGKVPAARIHLKDPLWSMVASIQLDKLQGAAFRVCARPDCINPPFRVGVRHKIFCSTDCAHLVAVRNSRNRAAQRAGRK